MQITFEVEPGRTSGINLPNQTSGATPVASICFHLGPGKAKVGVLAALI